MALTLNQLTALEWPATAAVVKRGIPTGILRTLAVRLGVPPEELGATLHLSTRTLHRRSQEGRLSLDESERLLSLARILTRAAGLLGNEQKAVRWLRSPVAALGGRTPLACADTQIGLREVEDVLTRIDDVVYS